MSGTFEPQSLTLATLAEPDVPTVRLRIGEQWVDITEVGNILIQAGEAFNTAFGIGAGDDE